MNALSITEVIREGTGIPIPLKTTRTERIRSSDTAGVPTTLTPRTFTEEAE